MSTATAEITDPTNTFVSLRVNSAGTTGEVAQQTLEQEIESVNGTSVTRVESDADDRIWTSIDPASGLEIAFLADGANTDLRIALDDASLPRPSDGTVFVWTWDMVFGPGGSFACAIASSAENGRIDWNFDCDPDDEIQRSGQASATPVEGAISWTWSWLRPDLPQWVWDYADVIPIPTCSIGCTYVLDFRWLSYEPVSLAPQIAPAGQSTAASQQHSVEQVNDAAATALATASSDAVQIVSQTRDEASTATQIVLQQLNVEQVASAQAVAVLSDAVNVSVDTAGVASQSNRASVEAEAQITSTIVQQIAQHAAGEDSFQTQVALQSASTTQVLVSAGIATIVKSINSGISVGGTSTQTTTSLASAAGAEASATRQTVEQEQVGNDADHDQTAGQWAVVAQEFELLAGASLADVRNESSLRDEASTLRIESEAGATGSSVGTIEQIAIQLQSGATTALQQESFQQATIEQAGIGLAAATAGGHKLIYRTPPPRALLSVTPETVVEVGSSTETAAGEPVLLSLPLIGAGQAAPIAPRAAAEGRSGEDRRRAAQEHSRRGVALQRRDAGTGEERASRRRGARAVRSPTFK